MKNNIYLVLSKIEVIQKTDKLIKKLVELSAEEGYESIQNSSINTMLYQKRKLIKELLDEMIRANLSFYQFRSLYEKIFAYLDTGENINLLPEDLQKKVNYAEQFLVLN